MPNDQHTRRKFLATLAATGAIAGTPFSPLSVFANSPGNRSKSPVPPRNEVDPIKIVSMMKLTSEEINQIKNAGKNVELIVSTNTADKAFREAEVLFGYGDGTALSEAKNLKWVQALGAGVENMPKSLVDHPVCLPTCNGYMHP